MSLSEAVIKQSPPEKIRYHNKLQNIIHKTDQLLPSRNPLPMKMIILLKQVRLPVIIVTQTATAEKFNTIGDPRRINQKPALRGLLVTLRKRHA